MRNHEDPDYWLTIYSPHLEKLKEHRLEVMAMGFTEVGEILPFEPWAVPATGKFFFKVRVMKGSMSQEELRALAEWDRLWSGNIYGKEES